MDAVTTWHFILAVLAGWVHREQLKVIEYLQAENRALREQLGNKRLRFPLHAGLPSGSATPAKVASPFTGVKDGETAHAR
jgi:hypothetical protein